MRSRCYENTLWWGANNTAIVAFAGIGSHELCGDKADGQVLIPSSIEQRNFESFAPSTLAGWSVWRGIDNGPTLNQFRIHRSRRLLCSRIYGHERQPNGRGKNVVSTIVCICWDYEPWQ